MNDHLREKLRSISGNDKMIREMILDLEPDHFWEMIAYRESCDVDSSWLLSQWTLSRGTEWPAWLQRKQVERGMTQKVPIPAAPPKGVFLSRDPLTSSPLQRGVVASALVRPPSLTPAPRVIIDMGDESDDDDVGRVAPAVVEATPSATGGSSFVERVAGAFLEAMGVDPDDDSDVMSQISEIDVKDNELETGVIDKTDFSFYFDILGLDMFDFAGLSFSGAPGELLSRWKAKILAAFILKGIEEDAKQVAFASMTLGGPAMDAVVNAEAAPETFTALLAILEAMPTDSAQVASVELLHFHQGSSSVKDYAAKVEDLCRRVGIKEEPAKILALRKGLNPRMEAAVSSAGAAVANWALLLAHLIHVEANSARSSLAALHDQPDETFAAFRPNGFRRGGGRGRGHWGHQSSSPQRPHSQVPRDVRMENAKKLNICVKCLGQFGPNHQCFFYMPSPPSSVYPLLGAFGRDCLIYVEGVLEGRRVRCMVDSGASQNFVSTKILKVSGVMNSVGLADGTPRVCTGPQDLTLNACGFSRKFPFMGVVMDYEVVLGMNWLQTTGVKVDFASKSLIFPSHSDSITLNAISAEELSGSLGPDDFVFLCSIQEVKGNQPTDPRILELVEEFDDVFPDKLPMELPPNRGCAFKIVLVPGAQSKVRPMKRFSPADMESLTKEVSSLLEAGLIRPSESEFGAQVLFVDKKDGTRRMCIDYRSLNQDTVKMVYPLPRIDELFDRLNGAKVFTKLDLRSGYHQMLMDPDDSYKTAFRTPLGAFEFLVLPFGLANAPSAFVKMISQTFPPWKFKHILGDYVDDLLIFSKNTTQHVQDLRLILEKLREAKLYVKKSKCAFAVEEVEYLGFLVGKDGIRSDPSKVEAIVKMPAPKDASALRTFLGMMNYFSGFIRNYAGHSAILNDLLQKDSWQDFVTDKDWRAPNLAVLDKRFSIILQHNPVFFR